jgi:glycosyltransferase involved in cell wall biosynthesis
VTAWQTLSGDALNHYAWQAICKWPQAARFDPIYQGLDFSELTRIFLCDKVARAMRYQLDIEQFWVEANLLIKGPTDLAMPMRQHLSRTLYPWVDRVRALKWRSQQHSLIYLPAVFGRWGPTFKHLRDSSHITMALPSLQSRECIATGYSRWGLRLSSEDKQFAQDLHAGITIGLACQDIELLPQDILQLRNQINQQLQYIKVVEADLSRLKPKALFTYADNHFPVQEAVLIARREGIPSIMLQHGLDCEQYYLEQAYASSIAVWGEARAHRYRTKSVYQPERIAVTGNPAYDDLCLPLQFNPQGDYWLWVTRPHTPEKCFSPARFPQEGLDLLIALLEALQHVPQARLVIKPHPADYASQYQDLLSQHHLGDRVTVSQTPVLKLLSKASVVISEDSTAGLEAMFFGKPLIHAHFCEATPTLNFVEKETALPGFSPEMLVDSLKNISSLTVSKQKNFLAAQRDFLKEHLGPCDGHSGERLAEFVLQTL